MKLHFEPNLDYQHAAIVAVCDPSIPLTTPPDSAHIMMYN